MASSQVDIAASSNPFGCILRHHNRRDGCHESSARTPQSNNNLKDLVRTRVRTRTPDNFKTTNDTIDSWIKNQDKETSNDGDIVDRWAAPPQNSAQEELSIETMSPPSITSSPSSSPQKPLSRGAAASSLVQIWEARLGRSTAPSMVSNSSGHCDSPPRYNENTSFNDETSPHLETLGDLETTQRMNPDEPAPLQGSGSPFGAPEMTDNPRVADIIRRFVTFSSRNGNKNSSRVNEKSESPHLKERDSNRDCDRTTVSGTDCSEQKSTLSLESNRTEQRVLVHCSTNDDDSKGSDHLVEQRRLNISQCPRIRGRQALKELLSLMEMDRKKELDNLGERKPVSNFTHKGRIQSLLKLKIIQRGLALQNQWRPYTGSTALQPHHSSHGSTSANYWRENMTAATDKVIKAKPADTASSSICQVTSDSNPNNSHCEIKQRIEEEQQIQSKEKPISESSVGDETSVTWNARNQDAGSFFPSQDSSCSPTVDVVVPANEVGADETIVASNAEDGVHHEEPSETIFRDANGGEDSVGVPESVDSCYGWYQEWTQLEGDDDHEDDEKNQDETLEDEEDGYEWFLGVSRPRSYWENLRQSWYRQVLETDSTNAEIRQLLERRTVSNFLTTSEFQDRMNNMMMTHIEEQNHRLNEDEDQDHSAMGSLETMRRFLSSYLQQQTQSPQINSYRSIAGEEEEEDTQEIQEEEQTDEEDDDEETLMRRQERMEEVMSNCLQVSSSQDLDQEESDEEEDGDVIDENEFVREDQDDGSPNNWRHNDTQMTLWSCRYNPTNNDRLSMEMEVINDLRAQIKELHQEMSELRRSISSCVNMQVKLQDSIINQEIISTVRVERNTSDERAPRKGYCCICYDTKVDSLLYRCGHMCTCFKCAQELQMGSGKCPICRASILDVVRAYTDS